MSCDDARMSNFPARKLVGTSMLRSETRRWSEECSARCMYQSIGVLRNSLIARRASSGSGIGSMKPLCESTWKVIGPTGQPRGDLRSSGLPASFIRRAALTVIGLRIGRGTKIGASIEAKVSPGTPPTANRPVTRSG